MDVDPAPPNRQRPAITSAPVKRAAVPGPGRQEMDRFKESSQRHQEHARHARADLRQANQANDQLRVALDQAEHEKSSQNAQILAMQHHIAESTARVDTLEKEGTRIIGMFTEEQKRTSVLYNELHETQRALQASQNLTHNLQRNIAACDDETLELRSQLKIAKKQLTTTPSPPKRRGRVSMQLLQNTSRAAQEIPFDPAPMPTASRDISSPASTPHTTRLAAQLNVGVEDLVGAMREICGISSDNDIHIVVPTPKASRPKAKAAHKNTVKPESKEMKDHAHEMLRIQHYKMFGVTVSTEFCLRKSATKEEVASYEKKIREEDLMLDDDSEVLDEPLPLPKAVPQWDFEEGYLQSYWNKAYVQRIVDEAIAVDAEGMNLVGRDKIKREFLEIVLLEQLERIRYDWNKFQPRVIPGENRLETKAEATARGEFFLGQRRQLSKKINGQHAKHQRRLRTVDALIYIKKHDGARDLAAWERILEILTRLEPAGMSEEEESSDLLRGKRIKTFTIQVCVWREPEIVNYMKMVDRETARLEHIHGGVESAIRTRGTGKGKRSPPTGLPKCFYNQIWLASQSMRVQKELKVSKEAFALLVAVTERMYE